MMLTLFLIMALLALTTAFVPSKTLGTRLSVRPTTELFACRRNNKEEKRLRNREYSRRWANKAGTEERKMSVLEAKRNVIARAEEEFAAQMFQLTTDEDMPAYTAFDFV